MKRISKLSLIGAPLALFMSVGAATSTAATTVQIGDSGRSYASSTVQCSADPSTGQLLPSVVTGLFNPDGDALARVFLNGTFVDTLDAYDHRRARVWLADDENRVALTLGKGVVDRYTYSVPPGMCNLPDTSGNTVSADGTLEYAASGKSSATVTPGCALNPGSGVVQHYVNLSVEGNYLLNVSVNGEALTQLSPTRSQTPVFLSAGQNVISAANGYVSIDYYVRDGGTGVCSIP